MNHHWFRVVLKLMGVKFGSKLELHGVPIVVKKSNAKITFGNNVIINSSFLSNLVGLYSRTAIVARTNESHITIGNNVGISGATIYARRCITIGNNTMIGGNVKILDNDFHPLQAYARNANDHNQIGTKPIVIGENCFIGCNAIILKGTVLGDGCVVGAGAVVSGVFENNSVIGGNPAMFIKYVNQLPTAL